MSSLAKNMKTLAAVVGLAAAGVATGAQAQTNQCGITGQAPQGSTIYYDPFDEAGIPEATVVLPLKRENFSGGGDTRIVNFYLKEAGNRADGTKIIPISVVGSVNVDGLGLNIFYGSAGGFPTLTPIDILPNSNNRFLKINFTGNNTGSDTASATFKITLPPLSNLEATQQLAFDAYFSCNIQGGKSNGLVQDNGVIRNAVVFPVTVLSALRASFQGTAFDFGEIGQVTTAQASSQSLSNRYVRVESSGAYSVKVESANGYFLKNSGTTQQDKIGYKINFLNKERSPSDASPLTETCSRAGIGTAQSLPITATLVEGGAGKNPSTTYSDFLTVTLEPLIYGATGTACS